MITTYLTERADNEPSLHDLIKGRCGICEYRDVWGGQQDGRMALSGIILRLTPLVLIYRKELNG